MKNTNMKRIIVKDGFEFSMDDQVHFSSLLDEGVTLCGLDFMADEFKDSEGRVVDCLECLQVLWACKQQTMKVQERKPPEVAESDE